MLASLGTLAALIVGVTTAANQPQLIAESTIPVGVVRGVLPADGEVVTHIIKADVWPDNTHPFERNEVFEMSLGRAIRAKLKDRNDERSLSPGVTFLEGYIQARGGWRLHKRVDNHPDYFDGTFDAAIAIGYADGRAWVASDMDLSWRPSWVAKVAFPVAAIVVAVAKPKIEQEVENRINTGLAATIEQEVDKLLRASGLPATAKRQVVGDITPAGLRLRLFSQPVAVVRARLSSNIDYTPPKIGRGDPEFGGNGPHVKVDATLSNTADSVILDISMNAEETKHRDDDKKWTRAQGSKRFEMKPGAGQIIGVFGRRSWVLFNEEAKGHDPIRTSSPLGRLEVRGDRKGADAGEYTGFSLRLSHDVLLLVVP